MRGMEAKELTNGRSNTSDKGKLPCKDSLHQRVRTGYVTCAKMHNHTLQIRKYIVI